MSEILKHFKKDLYLHFVSALVVAILLGITTIPGVTSLVMKGFICALLFVLISLVVALRRTWKGVWKLIALGQEETDYASPIVFEFLLGRLDGNIKSQRDQLTSNWYALDVDELEKFVDICFRHCKGQYIGTDRHIPSEFFNLYPRYLVSEKNRRATTGDIRVLIVNLMALQADDQGRVGQFMQAHFQDGPRLLRADFDAAQVAAARQDLPSPDIGKFGNRYVVFFEPPPARNRRAIIRVQLRPINNDLHQRLRAYLLDLNQNANGLVLRNGIIEDQVRNPDEINRDAMCLDL